MQSKFSLSDYLKSSCELKVHIAGGLYRLTNGNPCKECALKKDCAALRSMQNMKRHTPAPIRASGLNNVEYARTDKAFNDACSKAKCNPTPRQASKFRIGKGIAYKVAIAKTMEPLKYGEPGCSI